MNSKSIMRQRFFGVLAPILALSLAVVGCGSVEAGSDRTSSAGAEDVVLDANMVKGEGKKIVLFTYAPANTYIRVYTETLQAQLESMGYDLQIFTNSFSQSQEDQQVQQYLATGEKPALFLWTPFDDKGGINSTRLLSRVAPVVQLNAPLLPEGEEYVTAFSGLNSYAQGQLMGEVMKQARAQALKAGTALHGPGGNMLVFQGSTSNIGSKERYRGFVDATADEPFTVLEQSNNLSPDEAFNNTLTLAPKYKSQGIDFVWVYTDSTAAGVLRGLRQSGLNPGEDVQVVGGNCGDVNQILDGSQFGTTLQVAYVEGMAAAYTAIQTIASGNKVIDGEFTFPATDELPALPMNAPHKFNYIPLRAVVGASDVENTQLWGKSVDQLCFA